MDLSTKEKLEIFARYIGKHVWIENLQGLAQNREPVHQCGILKGIKEDALLVASAFGSVWMPFNDSYRYKLLLHPLNRLTEDIVATANALPATGFISQYYIKLGFDMPVFIAPDHRGNGLNAAELGLADYRSPREITELNYAGLDQDIQTRFAL